MNPLRRLATTVCFCACMCQNREGGPQHGGNPAEKVPTPKKKSTIYGGPSQIHFWNLRKGRDCSFGGSGTGWLIPFNLPLGPLTNGLEWSSELTRVLEPQGAWIASCFFVVFPSSWKQVFDRNLKLFGHFLREGEKRMLNHRL